MSKTLVDQEQEIQDLISQVEAVVKDLERAANMIAQPDTDTLVLQTRELDKEIRSVQSMEI